MAHNSYRYVGDICILEKGKADADSSRLLKAFFNTFSKRLALDVAFLDLCINYSGSLQNKSQEWLAQSFVPNHSDFDHVGKKFQIRW